jgi:hypothetical protein
MGKIKVETLMYLNIINFIVESVFDKVGDENI